jgi:hypothetical protein
MSFPWDVNLARQSMVVEQMKKLGAKDLEPNKRSVGFTEKGNENGSIGKTANHRT